MTTYESVGVPSVKIENDLSAAAVDHTDTFIKPDPESLAATPSGYADDDIYEDAGDLDFSQCDPQLWLMRLPKYIWEKWANIAEDDEIKLGKIRVEKLVEDGKEQSKVGTVRIQGQSNPLTTLLSSRCYCRQTPNAIGIFLASTISERRMTTPRIRTSSPKRISLASSRRAGAHRGTVPQEAFRRARRAREARNQWSGRSLGAAPNGRRAEGIKHTSSVPFQV
jgi:hypothetical protein